MHVDELRQELGRLADEMQVPATDALERVRQERRRRQRRTWGYATLCLVVVVLGGIALAVANRDEPGRVVTGLANDPPPTVTSAQPTFIPRGVSTFTLTLRPDPVMPDLIGKSFESLFDGSTGRLTQLAEASPLTFHWAASDTAPINVVFAQTPSAGHPSTGPVELWISVGGPIVSLDSLSAADREVARRIGVVDDREPIQKIETSAGPAYKVDAFLFAADCKAVRQAYRTSIDPSYGDVCTSEPGRMLGM
jgi:hypothetical protein